MGANVDRDVESGVMLLARELIVFHGEGTDVPENTLDLASIDTAGEYLRSSVTSMYMEKEVIDKL